MKPQDGAHHVRGRFGFGENWKRYLASLTEERIRAAEASLKQLLHMEKLEGMNLLDVGSGSGLFSLAARRLGARVHSFDADPVSVACTAELRERYFPGDPFWVVEEGSVLDAGYLKSLGEFDVVYAWGVLHHTGAMWQALDNVAMSVTPGGRLVIAIYNDQGRASRYWALTKQVYNWLPWALKPLILLPAFVRLWGPTLLRDLVRARPLHAWRGYASVRGMSPWPRRGRLGRGLPVRGR